MHLWCVSKASLAAIGSCFFLIAASNARAGDALADGAAEAGTVTENEKWFLRIPQDGKVIYRGVVSLDRAGNDPGAMLYPAPNLGGFLAALIAHGLINESVKTSEKDRLQSSADKVLSSYSAVLESFNFENLMQRALPFTTSGADGTLLHGSAENSGRMVVESYPVFSMTQDEKAIVLDNAIVIQLRGASREHAYKNTIKVISDPKDLVSPFEFWTANIGENLKVESAHLVAESFDIAFRDLSYSLEPEGATFRTIRYREGGVDKFERSKVLVNRCGRAVIRSLRGTLMSVPLSRPTPTTQAGNSCTP